MSLPLHRREMLAGLASLPVVFGACAPRALRGDSFTVTTCGQLLMKHAVCQDPYADLDAVIGELRKGDVTMSGLEVPIRTAASGAPTREGLFLHMATPEVLPCLQHMGFDMLALSNNHAYDLGTEGILATRAVVAEHGFVVAGTGPDLAAASAPGLFRGPPRVALVAMAIGKIADGGAATDTRPGVHEVRFDGAAPFEPDVLRVLVSIQAAAAMTDLVIVYLSNHEWGEDRAQTKPWVRRLAQRCADAGAGLFVGHGAPLLHGLERHGDCAIFHSLGSLVFHSRTLPGHYPPEVWESAIAHVRYTGGRLESIEMVPVALNEIGDDPGRHEMTRGRPRLATGTQALTILARFVELSRALGVSLEVRGERAWFLG